jgi:hypothetical protein
VTLIIDGSGPIATLFRVGLGSDPWPDLTILCRSLGSAVSAYPCVAPNHRVVISVNGLSAPLHEALANDDRAHAINFTAWLGLADGEIVVRQPGTVLTHESPLTDAIAKRLASTFALTVTTVETALSVQILKLAVNLPGVVLALSTAHHGKATALNMELATLRALAAFLDANAVHARDIGQFPVRRLFALSSCGGASAERIGNEIEGVLRSWRGGRQPAAVRQIMRGDAAPTRDMRDTLSHIGVPPTTVQALFQPFGVDSCRS